ncbi:TPA: GNAT family N-acetyltransferase [Serratia rubidaea]|nr:GNAT family N-acetyltransferase [Serratia rubidaea]HDJ1449712.1 GNAT family N-acetyltransferase [Serratia rubidaea]HDJ1459991.1 GNAT family N-acetyltransferase [Serratia rubidaea]HDJ2774730.1 GNAT family N-acetyltransferase [Serratia rubidaea]
MKRRATKDDLPFISKLIIDGAQKKHFNRKVLTPMGRFLYKINLKSMVLKGCGYSQGYKRRMEAFIWNKNETPIGFVVIAQQPDELLLAAISPEYRGKGYGREMLDTFLIDYIARKRMVWARCYPASKIMKDYLLRRGFEIYNTSKSGDLILRARYNN